MNYIPFQLELKPESPNVAGNKDYTDFRNLLERIDELLIAGGVEQLAFESLMNSIKQKKTLDGKELLFSSNSKFGFKSN